MCEYVPFYFSDILTDEKLPEKNQTLCALSSSLKVDPCLHSPALTDDTKSSCPLTDLGFDLSIPQDTESRSPLQSPVFTQTPSSFTYDTPRKSKYRSVIKTLTRENENLKEENKALKEQLDKAVDNVSLEQYEALTFKFCKSSFTAHFINVQVRQGQKHPKGRRYSKNFKNDCLAIYFAGPRVYKQFLMKKFCLPTAHTLLKEIRAITINPGLDNPAFFSILKKKVDSFQEQNKYCIICFDEMSIKANLFYDRSKDVVIGLAVNNQGEKIFKPALTVCVLMLRGIRCRWKQPLAYLFCHNSCPATFLKQILTEALHKLQLIGLKVCAVTSDMGSNNLQLSKILNVSPEISHFNIADQNLFYIFDIPHIIKAMRNMLSQHNFYIDGKVISWQYIASFYEQDKKYPVRAAPKLCDSHIKPNNFEKMKVKFATQIFSASVSTGMGLYIRFGCLPAEAEETANFIDRVDKLFDILNSSQTSPSKKYNAAFKALPYQMDFLTECLDFFTKLEVRNKKKNINITKKVKFIKCLQISINSIIQLFNYLNNTAGFDYLFSRRLNQDCLENHFGKIRRENGNCFNPTPIQFIRTFKKLQCVNLLNSGAENCEADWDSILLKFEDLQDVLPEEPEIDISRKRENDIINNANYSKEDILQTNFVRYICGYIFKKSLQVHSCELCLKYSKEHDKLEDSSYFCFLKAYENKNNDFFGNLTMPSDTFVEFIIQIEGLFQKHFEDFITSSAIIGKYLKLCENIPYSHPCDNFPKIFAVKLYLRVRMYYTLKNINNNFRNINKNKLIILRNQ